MDKSAIVGIKEVVVMNLTAIKLNLGFIYQ